MNDKNVLPLPLTETQWAWLRAPFPLTEEEWDYMMALLDAMKPGLVALSPSPSTPKD